MDWPGAINELFGPGGPRCGPYGPHANLTYPRSACPNHRNWGVTGIIPVGIMFMVVLIQTLHTVTHWRMEIDADAYCKNNAEWVESNENDDYY